MAALRSRSVLSVLSKTARIPAIRSSRQDIAVATGSPDLKHLLTRRWEQHRFLHLCSISNFSPRQTFGSNMLTPIIYNVSGPEVCAAAGTTILTRHQYSSKHNADTDQNQLEVDNQSANSTDDLGKSESVQEKEEQLSVYQKFKKTYKEHGKVLIAVHVATSIVWFGSFYTAARSGVDLVPWLEQLGLSETIIKPFRSGGLGYVALAYLMYKLATPARYTVTLAGTNFAIRYLRKTGKMNPVPEGHRLRELYKDGKVEFRDRSNLPHHRQKHGKGSKEKKRITHIDKKK